jgi:uncharacterized protein
MSYRFDATLLPKSNRGHRYIFDRGKKKTLLCHPLLFHLAVLYREKKENALHGLEELLFPPSPAVEEDVEISVELEDYGTVSRQELQYYYRKFLYLKKNGYFRFSEEKERLGYRFKAADVESQLANLKQVTFEVTDACNMNCRYCGYGHFYNDYDQRNNKMLSIPAAKTLLTYLGQFWNSNLNVSYNNTVYISFYGGEPLLNIEFVREIVDFIKTMDVPRSRFCFSMTTNGLLLAKHMDFLVDNGFRLLISLDGNKANNEYRVLRNGKPAYDLIIENVEILRNKHPQFFNTNVNFNAVYHNKNEVSHLYRYFKETYDKIPSIGELNTSGIREDKRQEFWSTYANVRQDLLKSEDYSFLEQEMFIRLSTIQAAGTFLDQFGGYSYATYRDLLYSNFTESNKMNESPPQRTPTGTCSPFSRRMFVTVNGKIMPCERISQCYSLGQVTEDSVSLDFDAIAQYYNRYLDKVRKMCERCYNRDACTQCMFNMDIEKDNPPCPGFTNEDSFARQFSQFMSYLENNPGIYSRLQKEVIVD